MSSPKAADGFAGNAADQLMVIEIGVFGDYGAGGNEAAFSQHDAVVEN